MSSSVKKSIMYASGEDFYLFCYAVFILLDSVGCKNDKFFTDYRKLAFLIEFIRDEQLLQILDRGQLKETLNSVDKEYLFNSYSTGLSRRSELLKLLFTLEKKKYLTLEKGSTKSLIKVSLNKKDIPKSFFDKKMFSREYCNAERLRKSVRRISILTLDTMLEKLYKDNGITTWAV